MTVIMALWFCVCSLSSRLLEIHTKIFTFEIQQWGLGLLKMMRVGGGRGETGQAMKG